jgi:uncharacterized delta-60 repeat protein
MQKTCFYFILPIVIMLSGRIMAQPGSLDLSFGGDGIVNNEWTFTSEIAAGIVVSSSGRIIALTSSNPAYLLGFKIDGSVDSSFGINGKIDAGLKHPTGIAIDELDRILALDFRGPLFFDDWNYVHRYLPNGILDTSFNDTGVVKTNIATANRAIISQPDNKVVVGGRLSLVSTIERYMEDGSADLTFNGSGQVKLSALANSRTLALALQQDGKLLVTGIGATDMFLARLNADGSLDNSFDGDGFIAVNLGATEAGQAIATLSDGRIIVSGHSETIDESSMLLWSFLPDGSPDSSFGTNGMVTLFTGPANNFGWFVYPVGDTAIIAGGNIYNGHFYEPVMFRVMNDGSIDNSFGTGGITGKTFECGQSIQVTGLKTNDDKLLICGTGFHDGNNRLAISRFLSDGLIDGTFAQNGNLFTSSGQQLIDPYPLLLNVADLPDGRILETGKGPYDQIYFAILNEDGLPDSAYGSDGIRIYQNFPKELFNAKAAGVDSIFYVAEYSSVLSYVPEDFVYTYYAPIIVHKIGASGLPDSSFGTNGIANIDIDTVEILNLESIAIQPDAKVLVSGKSSHGIYLVRLNTNGELDLSFGNDGIKIIEVPLQIGFSALQVRTDGKIILVEFVVDGEAFEADRRIYQLLPDGSLDANFGPGGYVSDTVSFNGAGDLILQPDNKLFILIRPYYSGEYVLGVNEDGSIDENFADDGQLNLFNDDNRLASFTMQPDGKIITSRSEDGENLLTERYLNNGAPDSTWGIAGVTPISGYNWASLSVQDDGKILVWNLDGEFIARLNNDCTNRYGRHSAVKIRSSFIQTRSRMIL